MRSPRFFRRAFVALPVLALASARLLALDPALPPSDNFNLTHWNLTLPVDSSGGYSGTAITIDTPALSSGYTNSPYFYTANDGGMAFGVPYNGATAGTSDHPRSELRECFADGTLYNWLPNDPTGTTHTLTATCVPNTASIGTGGCIAIGQIHGKQPNIPAIILRYYASGRVAATVKYSPNDAVTQTTYDFATVGNNPTINYTLQVVGDAAGNVDAYLTVNGQTVHDPMSAHDPAWATTTFYFKAGNYNVAPVTGNTAVNTFYALMPTHTKLDPALAPSGNFDLTHWKLTLPTGSSGNPDEILPAQLSAGYTNSPYFCTASDGAMRFWTPVTGVTTGGSSYPRTELREQISPGNDTPNWYGSGTHTLSATVVVRQVPSSGKCIIGQIHGKTDPNGSSANPLVKLAYNANDASVHVQIKDSPYTSNTAEQSTTVGAGALTVGTKIRYTIQVVNGVATVTINDYAPVSRDFFASDPGWQNTDLYFKAGSYCQDNSGTSSEGAKVDFYALSASHGGSPTITTASLPGGRTGVSYGNQQLTATGGTLPCTWSLTSGSLPAGLALNSAGVISGTPTSAGTASFTVRVTDAGGQTDTKALSITINTNSIPDITTTSLPTGAVGVGYSQTVSSTGGDTALAWSVVSGSLPAGLSLGNVNNQNCTITGTPSASGTSNFTLQLADIDGDTDSQALAITVASDDPEVVPVAAPDSTPWDTAGNNGPPQIYDGVTADGGSGSRWASNASPDTLATAPRYVTLDLGAAKAITKFVVWPYQARAYSYKIYVSSDGVNFGSPVVNVQQTTGATSFTHVLGSAAIGRYVKLLVDGVTGVSTTWASINEFDIFGTAANPPPDDPEVVPVAAPDSTPWDTAGNNGPPQIYDGVTADGGSGSRWASNASPDTLATAPRYVTLDLGAAKSITKFVVWPYQARAYSYKIYVSSDGVNFGSPVVNVQQTTGATSYTHLLGTAASGRYVKLLVDGVTGVSTTWASINEFDIFGH